MLNFINISGLFSITNFRNYFFKHLLVSSGTSSLNLDDTFGLNKAVNIGCLGNVFSRVSDKGILQFQGLHMVV